MLPKEDFRLLLVALLFLTLLTLWAWPDPLSFNQLPGIPGPAPVSPMRLDDGASNPAGGLDISRRVASNPADKV
jgi:hypothetical protein